MESLFDDPFGGKGRIVRVSPPDKVVWMMDMGDGQEVYCTKTLTGPMLENNERDINDSAGQRWGEGRRVASIPLDLYFKLIAPARRADDEKYVKKILNDGDYAKFRTFGGRI